MPNSCSSRFVAFSLPASQFTAAFVLIQGKMGAHPSIKDNVKQNLSQYRLWIKVAKVPLLHTVKLTKVTSQLKQEFCILQKCSAILLH